MRPLSRLLQMGMFPRGSLTCTTCQLLDKCYPSPKTVTSTSTACEYRSLWLFNQSEFEHALIGSIAPSVQRRLGAAHGPSALKESCLGASLHRSGPAVEAAGRQSWRRAGYGGPPSRRTEYPRLPARPHHQLSPGARRGPGLQLLGAGRAQRHRVVHRRQP